MNYSEKDLAALISEVEDEFSKHLAKAEEEQTVEEVTSEKNEEEVIAKAEESTEEVAKAEESYEYDKDDIEEMNKLYCEMSKSEKEAHYKSVKKALFGEVSEESMTKSEVETEVETEKEETIAKSEYEALQEKNEELQKSLEGLTSALNKFLKGNKAPKQKAITKIQYMKKSEETDENSEKEIDYSKMSKSEISKILSSKIRSGEVKKNEDKEAINAFYLEDKPIETIKHLL